MDDVQFVDSPNKKQLHPHYEHRTRKLDEKNNQFTSKEFQKVRRVSTKRNLIKSFSRIGMCVNNLSISILPKKDLYNVCFIIINDYNRKNIGVGPLNDGYLIGNNFFKKSYKIFYLYNASYKEFPVFLQFFMNNTINKLLVFYSGKNDDFDGIEFINGSLTKSYIEKLISFKNFNRNVKIIFVTDTAGSGSVFDVKRSSNSISFSVEKMGQNSCKYSHGIFTFYLCKILSDCPNISPYMLIQKLNEPLNRFNEICKCDYSSEEQLEKPIF